MRIVVQFDFPGDWDCAGSTMILPIEHESAEAFYVEFVDAMEAYIKARAVYKVEHAKWLKNQPRLGRPKGTTNANLETRYFEWSKKEPQMPHAQNMLKIGTFKDYATTFLLSEKEYIRPTVLTVDEWYGSVE